ncbi:MAG: acetyl-CoA C-acetyltransferase, partial [Armatimonadetes bacterium]|nr:acetyl-CoA C-acetyltransferase [Armatimonadota bacterium]NIM24501.1 acetyl-CoA C-acetyltransferase [Armatimonadota bacterium]NIM68373.1 acetyl-CoA C-acetyltransferase [Armatimonadota bacterium]NIN06575.1 acetyl-CoA C-acetyltransferase [Armatimonadota bacterium]NIO98206.1 acetyl-CoA C-acetyltransferase [Armatimonadota bacterium]
HMGSAAELCAERFEISRADQDSFAVESYRRAQTALRQGDFKKEIVAVKIPRGRGESALVEEDEEVTKFDEGKLRQLKPAFRPDG